MNETAVTGADQGRLSNQASQQLIREHAPLVRRIALHLAARLPASVEVDDLIQSGLIGLLDAARHYQGERGASFETYAGIRIRGAMLDELRRSDWTPRSVHRQMREAAQIIHRLEQQTGHAARETDVAAHLGLGLPEYQRLLQDAARCQLSSLTAPEDGEDGPREIDIEALGATPAEHFESGEFQARLAAAIALLPERERLLMSLYYEQELNLREIGAVLEVTESRVCQMHGQALLRLRARLPDWVAPQARRKHSQAPARRTRLAHPPQLTTAG